MKRPLPNNLAKKNRSSFSNLTRPREQPRKPSSKNGPNKIISKNGHYKSNFHSQPQNGPQNGHHQRQNGFHKSNENSSGNDSDANDFVTQQRRSLPIFSIRQGLINSIEEHSTAILIGETGCGKTTQIPQFALETKMARNNANFRVGESIRSLIHIRKVLTDFVFLSHHSATSSCCHFYGQSRSQGTWL